MSAEGFKIEKYKEVIFLSILVILITGFFVNKLVPIIQHYYNLTQQVEQKKTELDALQLQLKATKEKFEKQNQEKDIVLKKIYVPSESDLDNDSLFHDMNNDIIEMLALNGVKANSVDYSSNPEDDSFISKAEKNMYKVDELKMELISDFTNFDDFLKSLYKYPYFLKFKSIDIVPYQHNPKIIVINFVTRLYGKTMPEGQ